MKNKESTRKKIVWQRFKSNKLAFLGVFILAFFVFLSIFAEFLAPYSGQANTKNNQYLSGPPQTIHFCDADGCSLRPFVYKLVSRYDIIEKSYTVVKATQNDIPVKLPIYFFVKGSEYRLWWIFKSDRHLFGVEDGMIHLFGTDKSGIDLFSRLMFATRTSLTIGVLGVLLAFIISLILGGIAGYFGGQIDNIIQHFTDIVRVLPEIPLFMALSATFPIDWSNKQVFFAMTIVLGFTSWPTLARRIRTHILSIRQEDYVKAARIYGASPFWIIRKHLLPSFLGYIIVELIINFPYMILKETSLSIVGLGLTRPTMSWGVLLQEMTTIESIQLTPWYFIPLLFFMIAVLAFAMVGDGMRQAINPQMRKPN